MDNYPSHLAPKKGDNSEKISFENWYSFVKDAFPDVPEEVLRQWVYEHWGFSEYDWLPSANYTFWREEWRTKDLASIRSVEAGYAADNTKCFMRGEKELRQAATEKHPYSYTFLPNFMRSNQAFPVPIVVLDNRDNHLTSDWSTPAAMRNLPEAHILLEGHRRFSIALALANHNIFGNQHSVWVAKRKARAP